MGGIFFKPARIIMTRIRSSFPYYYRFHLYHLHPFIAFILADPVLANRVKKPINKENHVLAGLLEWNDKPDYAVVVDKSRQKVMLYRSDNPFSPEKIYDRSATGENDGPKTKKNDRKNP